jgi:transposase
MKRTSKNFTQIINIPELIVLGMNEDKEGFVFITKHLEKRCKCPKCGTLSTTVHQNKQSFVRDLSIGERPVYLLISRRQFKCKICKKPFTEQLSFLGKRKTYTTRLANFIVTEVVDSNVHSVAKRYGLTDDEVWSMVEFVGENIIPKQPPKFKKIGIDEISLVKGQGNFVVVIVDLERHKLIEIVSERKQKKIRDVMESWRDFYN